MHSIAFLGLDARTTQLMAAAEAAGWTPALLPHIKSVAFAANCVVITKTSEEDRPFTGRAYRYSDSV